MKKTIVALTLSCSLALLACGGRTEAPASTGSDYTVDNPVSVPAASADAERGMGKFKDVEVGPLNAGMAATGESVYEVKCASCHKMTDEKLVGPGWKDVTVRHTPAWIMNFVTNTDEMLDKDPKAQAMLEICLVRMPNQNVSDDDARALLEFMRKNDGAK